MTSSDERPQGWSESDSAQFIELGRVYTPTRDEIQQTILDLIPAERDDAFLTVELGVGGGWLSAAILERFPYARILGLDGSPTMLRETDARLQPFAGRYELREFKLEDASWLDRIGAESSGTSGPVRCFVSSLVVHHLDGDGKRVLYQRLHERLEAGGALLFADLLAPGSEWERRFMARQWDVEVRRQSLEMTGSLETYQRFFDDHWNLYDYPDPMDMPSTAPEHLRWLTEAGFIGASVFWARAGHAVYGGYKGNTGASA